MTVRVKHVQICVRPRRRFVRRAVATLGGMGLLALGLVTLAVASAHGPASLLPPLPPVISLGPITVDASGTASVSGKV